ncbi:MAG TPA: SgcJ/EcaC family oxidoreductase [Bryobacteraceae bacterium]|nr:SgcJ/EcaC family oxidoreductase [Bryobacteraceae bacterium]
MRKTLAVVPGTFLLLALAACNTAPPAAPAVDLSAEEGKIRDTETAQMKQGWGAKDIDKILAFYADDATLMTPGMAAMKGKDSMRSMLKTLVADPNLKLEFAAQRVEVSKSGDVAFSQGTYTMVVTDPRTKKPVTDKGSYVTGYKKQADGSWKAVSDINVSELPAPGSGQ